MSLSIEERRLLKSFDSVTPIKRIRFVPAKVKQFTEDFIRGALEPEDALREVARHNSELVNAWRRTPREKRVFIVGAGEDLPQIAKYRRQLEADGHAVFFYKFCIEPSGRFCNSEVVGAFFKTSGGAMLVDTPAATLSRYVPVEVATAQRLASGESQLILITPLQALTGGAATLTAAVVIAAESNEPIVPATRILPPP